MMKCNLLTDEDLILREEQDEINGALVAMLLIFLLATIASIASIAYLRCKELQKQRGAASSHLSPGMYMLSNSQGVTE